MGALRTATVAVGAASTLALPACDLGGSGPSLPSIPQFSVVVWDGEDLAAGIVRDAYLHPGKAETQLPLVQQLLGVLDLNLDDSIIGPVLNPVLDQLGMSRADLYDALERAAVALALEAQEAGSGMTSLGITEVAQIGDDAEVVGQSGSVPVTFNSPASADAPSWWSADTQSNYVQYQARLIEVRGSGKAAYAEEMGRISGRIFPYLNWYNVVNHTANSAYNPGRVSSAFNAVNCYYNFLGTSGSCGVGEIYGFHYNQTYPFGTSAGGTNLATKYWTINYQFFMDGIPYHGVESPPPVAVCRDDPGSSAADGCWLSGGQNTQTPGPHYE